MIGSRIAELRKAKKLSQYKMADLLGMSRGQIANYEQGQREPDFETAQKIADFFEVSVDYLLGRSAKPHLTEREERQLSLQALIDIHDRLARGDRGDIPEIRANALQSYLAYEIEKIKEEMNAQK